MHRFADLCELLDADPAPSAQVAALALYFGATPAADAAWALYFLRGGRACPGVPWAQLRALACQRAGMDGWLFDTCYQAVGELAETIAHLVPPAAPHAVSTGCGLAAWVAQCLLPLRGLPSGERALRVMQALDSQDTAGRWLLLKLVGGRLRAGAIGPQLQQALAQVAGVAAPCMALRLLSWADARTLPSAARWQALVAPLDAAAGAAATTDPTALGLPYPFFLAPPLPQTPDTLGPCGGWLVEWLYGGLRVQLIKRAGQVWLWSHGDALVTAQFPTVAAAAAALPDGTVLDGELLAWPPGSDGPTPWPMPQQPLRRGPAGAKLPGKTLPEAMQPGTKLLADAPVRFMAFDLLEEAGVDGRARPQLQRRAALQAVHAALGPTALALAPQWQAGSWAACAALHQGARRRGVQGLMLKQVSACYGAGQAETTGQWFAWQREPLSVHAVLVHAQAGRSGPADCSFALWSRRPASAEEAQAALDALARREPAVHGALQLLPFAKAPLGLSADECKAVDQVIRATTLQKFGPVRSLRPTLMFEMAFDGVTASPRHKSGVVVQAARVLRICHGKALHQADALPDVLALMPPV
jgi:DNA ligase-1